MHYYLSDGRYLRAAIITGGFFLCMLQPKKRSSLAFLPSLVEEAEDSSFHNEVSTPRTIMELSLIREIKEGSESEQVSHGKVILITLGMSSISELSS